MIVTLHNGHNVIWSDEVPDTWEAPNNEFEIIQDTEIRDPCGSIIIDGAVINKKVLSIILPRKNVIGNGKDTVILSGLIAGTAININNEVLAQSDGNDIIFTFDTPGVYSIVLHPPEQYFTWYGEIYAS